MSDKKTQIKTKTACFTGHRSIGGENIAQISKVLHILVRNAVNCGFEHFLCGGALGFDTMAALCVLEHKRNFPNITLDLILPCKNQTKLWNEHDRALYDLILSQADRVEFIREAYTSTCMHERNRALIDKSDVCIAYLAHKGGGTAYTVSYAESKNISVINIADII